MSSHSRYKMSGLRKNFKQQSEIDLTERFSSQMAQLCMNDSYSDVVFKVEDQLLPAHRVILAARSDYFRALLYGGMLETTQKEIELKVPLGAFKSLLKYIYSGHMPLTPMDNENILDILGLANEYGFIELETAISDYLKDHLTLFNACSILDAARLFHLDKLAKVCLKFIDRNADKIIQDESFKLLSRECLEEILRRDSFFAPEVKIFSAVQEWCKFNQGADIASAVSFVRLPLMALNDLLEVVRPSGILEPDKILDAIHEQNTSNQLPYRASLLPEENVAVPRYHAACIRGEMRSALLDGDIVGYDMEKGYTRHNITDSLNDCIVIQLGSIYLINHIRMLLWDRDYRSYSYYIEVSPNNNHWYRVVDYTAYDCRSWQYLYFEPCPVRFIRIVGTYNSVNKIFHLVSLEAMYTNRVPKLIKDIVVPSHNVATVEKSALVLDGVSRTRNALINGDYKEYDWDTGYTCHQLGSGEIVVRLGQPYYLSSLRLLLWDCDDRTYSYYIETSVNQKDWDMAVDRRNENCRAWQNCFFSSRPVVYIKIVGTHNTANEIFHCVHLECPTQDKQAIREALQQAETDNEGEKLNDLSIVTATDEGDDNQEENMETAEAEVASQSFRDGNLIDILDDNRLETSSEDKSTKAFSS